MKQLQKTWFTDEKRGVSGIGISRNTVFMMEMVLAILFFAVSAAVCTRVVATAKTMSDDAYELSCATSAVRDAAERFRADGYDEPHYYNAQWSPCDASAAAYTVETRSDGEKSFPQAAVRAIRLSDGETVLEITAASVSR